MHLIDGKALAIQEKSVLKERIKKITQGHRKPQLALLRVGHDPASEVYVRNKVKACDDIGMVSQVVHWPEADEQQVIDQISDWNARKEVHGILVQLPLPASINTERILSHIAVHKDVDGFHAVHTGRLCQGQKAIVPCTPQGVLKLIQSVEQNLRGLHAVIVGRSNIVGKPCFLLMNQQDCTTTLCHRHSVDLKRYVEMADILIVAVGQAELVRGHWIKPGAIVIDVGINRQGDKLCGDVEFHAAALRARAITPVPGGVGPMTIAMLLANTLTCYQEQEGVDLSISR